MFSDSGVARTWAGGGQAAQCAGSFPGVPRLGRPSWALGHFVACPCGPGTCSPLTLGPRNNGNHARLCLWEPLPVSQACGHFSPKSCRPMRKQRVRVGPCTSPGFGAQTAPPRCPLSALLRRKAPRCASHTWWALSAVAIVAQPSLQPVLQAFLQKETLSRQQSAPPPCPWPVLYLRVCVLWAFHRSGTTQK